MPTATIEFERVMGPGHADSRLEPIRERVLAGERLTLEEGELLYSTPDIWSVCEMADAARRRLHGTAAYYNINRHLNYSNICALSCKFCEFYRNRGQAGAYEHSIEDMVAMVKDDMREVHIVGGHHPDWPFEYYERMIQAIHAAHPHIPIKAFTAAEIDYFWRRWKVEPAEALARLKAEYGGNPEIDHMVNFIEQSKRGLTR